MVFALSCLGDNKTFEYALKMIFTLLLNDVTSALKVENKVWMLNYEIKSNWFTFQLDYIFVVSDTAGRFDHTIANINTLYKCRKFLHHDIQVRIHVLKYSNLRNWKSQIANK